MHVHWGRWFDRGREFDPHEKSRKGDFRPDLSFSIETDTAHAFYFLELCRGTEPFISSDKRRTSVSRKLKWYANMKEEWKSFADPFGEFNGFRVIWVVTRREKSTLKLCDKMGTGDRVGVAELGNVLPGTVIDEDIWAVPGLSNDRKFKLNWCPEDLENKR